MFSDRCAGRKGKNRCEGDPTGSNQSCRRCLLNGIPCVFEKASDRRERPRNDGNNSETWSSGDAEGRVASLEKSVQELANGQSQIQSAVSAPPLSRRSPSSCSKFCRCCRKEGSREGSPKEGRAANCQPRDQSRRSCHPAKVRESPQFKTCSRPLRPHLKCLPPLRQLLPTLRRKDWYSPPAWRVPGARRTASGNTGSTMATARPSSGQSCQGLLRL